MTQASQAKPEKRYYRIGEVARITGIKPYVLRYWESEFRWMSPAKSRSKQRLYRKRDIDTIQLIKKLLYEDRFTIEGARKRLRELGVDGARETLAAEAPASPSSPEAAQLELSPGLDLRGEFQRLRDELQTIRGLL